jgi:FkbM family methyltransferase
MSTFYGEKIKNFHVDKILSEYFPDDYIGTFVDVGAYEPINISNSYYFEKKGWDCHCFEANTDLIPLLKEHRKNVYNYAVSNEDKEFTEFNIVKSLGDGGGGGSNTASFSAIELNNDYFKCFDPKKKTIDFIKKIKVPQVSLNTIFNQLKIDKIDIMSIDVEGGELNVLKGLDLNKYKVGVFVIENILSDKSIKEYLTNSNYVLDKEIGYNQYYKKIR